MTGCTGQQRRSHKAAVGETLIAIGENGRMILVGRDAEIGCIPHEGCRLRIWQTAASDDPGVKQLQPLDAITYIQVRFLWFKRDLFLLPNGREVKLEKLASFQFELLSPEIPRPPREEEILWRAHRAREAAGAV